MNLNLSGLGEALKAKGLVLAEKEVKIATEVILDFVDSEAKAAGGIVGSVVALAVEQVKAPLLALEDKIDGVSGD